jgi:hypothetical protein
MDFDIVRYVLISLTYLGHNLGTTLTEKSVRTGGDYRSEAT